MELRSRSIIETHKEAQHPIPPKPPSLRIYGREITREDRTPNHEGFERAEPPRKKRLAHAMSTMDLSSTKIKRHSMVDKLDKDEKMSLTLERRQHTMVLRSHQCAGKGELSISTMELRSRGFSETHTAEQDHPPRLKTPSLQRLGRKSNIVDLTPNFEGFERTKLSANKILDPTTRDKSTVVLSSSRELLPKTRRADTGFEIAPKYTKGMEHWGLPCRGFPAKRSLQEKCERRKFNYNIRGIRKDSDETSVHFEHFKNTVHIKRVLDAKDIIFVNASAANFEVYSFLQKSTKIIRTKYQTEINASHDIGLWPDRILIAAKGTDSAFLHKFKLHDTRGTFQSKIAFFTGEDDNLVDVFCREALPETTICWIKPTGQTGSDRGEIMRTDWGFQCNVNDLSNNTTITECIDGVLQHLVLENLARAAEAIPKQGKRTEGILTEVKELFTLTKVPMPKWLTEWEPDSKSIAVLTEISEKVLTLPSVFACDVADAFINIMIWRDNESDVIDLITKLKTFGLSNEEINIHFKEI